MTIRRINPWDQHTPFIKPGISQGVVNIIHQTKPTPSIGAAFNPAKAGTKTAHVVFVLDDSGSMQSIRDMMISAFNEYVEGQKASEVPTFVSLYKFDGRDVTCVFSRKPVSEVSPLDRSTYNPQGMTNLYDAFGACMIEINDQLSNVIPDMRDSIVLGILTDGDENSSKVFNAQDVKQMVEKAEGQNWAFQFFGANIDAYSVGATMGFRAENTMQFRAENVEATMRGATRMSNDLKTAYATGMNTSMAYATMGFTDTERSASLGGKVDD